MAKKNTPQDVAIVTEMAKNIYQDLDPEARKARMEETADKILDYEHMRPYTEDEVAERRKRLADICIKISDLEAELAAEKAHYKALIQPEEIGLESIVSDLRTGGRMVTETCYAFVNLNIGKAGLYDGDGNLLREENITPEMEQQTIFQLLREAPEEQEQEEDGPEFDDQPDSAFQE